MRYLHTLDPDDLRDMDLQDNELAEAMELLREDVMMERYYEDKYNV